MYAITQKTARRLLFRALGWALLALALWGGFSGAERLAALWQTPSLRWRQPVPWQQASRLCQQGEHALRTALLTGPEAARALPGVSSPAGQERSDGPTGQGQSGGEAPQDGSAVCPTFWQEERTTVSIPRTDADAAVVWVLGRAALAWPAECLYGALPGRYDPEGCALSEGLAVQLFGTADAVGQGVRFGGRDYTVRGVFPAQDARLVANAGAGQSFGCAELDGLAALPDAEAAACSWAGSMGLAAPDTVVCGPGLASLAHAAAFLPFAAALALLLSALWRALCRCPAPTPQLAGWGLAFTAAGGLPLLAARLPGWLRPGRWSDTGFWQGVFRRLAGQAQAFLALPPTGRDLLAKQHLLLAFAAALAGLLLAAALAPRMDKI